MPNILHSFFVSKLFLSSLSGEALPTTKFSALPLTIGIPSPKKSKPIAIEITFITHQPLLLYTHLKYILTFLLFVVNVQSK